MIVFYFDNDMVFEWWWWWQFVNDDDNGYRKYDN